MIDEILGIIDSAVKIRQAKREQDKAKRQAMLDAQTEQVLIQRQLEAQKQGGATGMTSFFPGASSGTYMPIVLLGGVALVGVLLLGRR